MFRLSHFTVSVSTSASSWLALLETWHTCKSMTRVKLKTVKVNDLVCHLLNSTIGTADRQVPRFGAPTVKFNVSECRPSNSTIWSAGRRMRQFEVQPVKFNDLECPPSNSTIWSAGRRMRQFEVQIVKFNDLECPAQISLTSVSCHGRCKADHRRRVLLQLCR